MISAMVARQVEIVPAAPYDFARALDYLRASHTVILERIGSETYQRALRLAGHDVLLTLRAMGTVDAPRLLLEVRGAVVDDAVMAAAAAQMRHSFTLAVDPAPFGRIVAGDPILAAVVAPYPGLRPVLHPAPFESLIGAIIGQQITTAFAAKVKRTLYDLAGRHITIDGERYPLLPEPADIAALDESDLLARQFSRQKAAAVRSVARAVAAGEIDFAALAALAPEEAIARLTQHKGVGRWTAECVLMRGLGAQDAIPAGDIGLRAAIGRAYGLGRHATEAEVRERAAVWDGWRGWATFFWWHQLQMERLARGR
jgi:DNA-3-methyladenine glycosylase II